MSLRTFLIINAFFAAFFGLAFFLFPVQFVSGYGISLDPVGTLLARGLGGTDLGLAVINWYSRNVKDQKLLTGVILGNMVVHILTGLSDFLGYMEGTLQASFFPGLIIRTAVLVGFVYYLLKLRAK